MQEGGKMSNRRAQVIILVEDSQQETFIRSLLKIKGFGNRQIRCKKSPSGRGSAEQYVRENYSTEVKSYRARCTYQRQGLIVMIDADIQDVRKHFEELDEVLKQHGLEVRKPEETIAIFIPRMNVETWILFLRGDNVDEITDYTGRFHGTCGCYNEARAMITGCRDGFNKDGEKREAIPSLRDACPELARIPS